MAYGSDAGLQSYLSLTGRTLPTGVVPAVAREWGSQYVNMFERKYRGHAIALPDSFPRDIYDPVPVSVEYAAYEAAFAWTDGVPLFGGGGTAGGQVIEERVDVLSIKYAGPQEGSNFYYDNLYILPAAYSLLLPFFKTKFNASAFVVGPC